MVKGEKMREIREPGWLQKVFEEADKRVNEWPAWKKELVEKNASCNGADKLDRGTQITDDVQEEE